MWAGAAYEGAGAPPYWPWIEVLRAARRELGSEGWERHLPAQCAALPRLLPELGAQSAAALDAQLTRFQLFDELASLLASASGAAPRMSFEAAADLLSRALQKLLSEAGDPRTACELALAAGVDRYCAGDLEGAWHTLEQGAERARHVPGAADLLARFVFRLLDCAEAGAGDERRVRALLEHALQVAGDGAPDLRAALVAHRAELAYELPFAARVALLEEAEQLAARHGGAELVLEVANCRASVRDPCSRSRTCVRPSACASCCSATRRAAPRRGVRCGASRPISRNTCAR